MEALILLVFAVASEVVVVPVFIVLRADDTSATFTMELPGDDTSLWHGGGSPSFPSACFISLLEAEHL